MTDSREGIVRCIQHALVVCGGLVPDEAALTRYVGPPLPGSFVTLLGTDKPERIEQAIAAYRERFERVGMFENTLYPGIAEALAELSALGHSLSVVTAKPAVYARRILEHFGIAAMFRGVYGPTLGERAHTKETLVGAACVAEQVVRSRTTMVGDRAEDVSGARRNRVRAVGVTWGYGERAELEAALPDRLVDSPGDLLEYLRAV